MEISEGENRITSMVDGGKPDEDFLPWKAQHMNSSGAARRLKHLEAELENIRKDKESFPAALIDYKANLNRVEKSVDQEE